MFRTLALVLPLFACTAPAEQPGPRTWSIAPPPRHEAKPPKPQFDEKVDKVKAELEALQRRLRELREGQ